MAAGFPELGRILRLWRESYAHMSQADAALGTHYSSKSTVNMWEQGQRGIRFETVDMLDDHYGAGGAMADMAQALGSPHGIPGHRRWALNRQGPAGPNWAWLRPHPRGDPTGNPPINPTGHRMRARVEWCGFDLDVDELCSRDGVFVQFPSSDPGLAIRVLLDEPGWVNFGRAAIPPSLGIPVRDFLAGAQPIDGWPWLAGLVSPTVVSRYLNDPAFARRLRKCFGERPEVLENAIRAGQAGAASRRAPASGHHPQPRIMEPLASNTVADPLTGPPASRPFSGQDYHRLRRARCYSQAKAADEAEVLRQASDQDKGTATSDTVTKDKVGRVEDDGLPRIPHIRALLDRVYAADGHTCTERVEPLTFRSPFVVRFPRWWVGPVWFTFTPRDSTTPPADTDHAAAQHVEVEVHQRPAPQARLTVKPGDTIACRRHAPDAGDFSLHCPPGWAVTAGMGFQPHARELDLDRWAVSDPAIHHGAGIHPMLLHLFGLAEDDLAWTGGLRPSQGKRVT